MAITSLKIPLQVFLFYDNTLTMLFIRSQMQFKKLTKHHTPHPHPPKNEEKWSTVSQVFYNLQGYRKHHKTEEISFFHTGGIYVNFKALL